MWSSERTGTGILHRYGATTAIDAQLKSFANNATVQTVYFTVRPKRVILKTLVPEKTSETSTKPAKPYDFPIEHASERSTGPVLALLDTVLNVKAGSQNRMRYFRRLPSGRAEFIVISQIIA
jgi:hypothetical protein